MQGSWVQSYMLHDVTDKKKSIWSWKPMEAGGGVLGLSFQTATLVIPAGSSPMAPPLPIPRALRAAEWTVLLGGGLG